MLIKFFHKTIRIFVCFCILFCSALVISQNKNENKFKRFIDSANNYVDETPKIAELFLDSIPEPILKNTRDHLAVYYQIRGIINSKNDEQAQLYQNYLLALKYAEIEKNYDIAGMASLELFYNIYIIKQDSLAFKYLNKAKDFFTKSNNNNGLAEVMQMSAYVELYNKNYEKSNQLLLEHLEYYKSIKDDGYYYLYALFMLTVNNVYLDDLDKAHYYFEQLKELKKDTTIPASLHDLHMVTIYNSLAKVHFKNKEMDSTLLYLQNAGEFRKSMNNQDVRDYFGLYIDYYDVLNNIESKKAYVDSVQKFEEFLLSKTMDASFTINNTLTQTEVELKKETKKKDINRYIIYVLVAVLLLLTAFIVMRYKLIKQKISEFTKKNNEFSFLKTNQEKLNVKVLGLEEYIKNLKQEIKSISKIENVSEQHKKIKELYKKLHLNSSTLLDKSASHLEIVNELNADFFAKIKNDFPSLNDSEIIICYYLFADFKNKEIALFLNRSVRSIENKRYRIGKKINLQPNETLLDKLKNHFDSKSV